MNKKEVDIRTIDFNKVDDLRILLLLGDKKVTSLAKGYIIRKYVKRIKKMDFQYLSLLLLEIDEEILEICNDVIKNIFDDLSILEVESLTYANKNYTNVSKLIANLFKYDWFSKNQKYLMIKVAYELEKLRDNLVSERKIVRNGNKIIGELANEHRTELMDKVLKNYLFIVEKNKPSYALEFRKKGYKYIDNYLKKDKDITKNMLMFDVYMLKFQDYDKYQVYFEFYDNEFDSKYASHTNNLVKVNLASLIKVNNIEGDRKFALQYLFFAISREFINAYINTYFKLSKVKRKNLIEELRMHNIGVSRVLKKCVKKKNNLNHYVDEYCANVEALKEVYKRYLFFKGITDADKKKFNTYISKLLVKSFKSIDRKNSYTSSPIDYTFNEFKKYKLSDDMKEYLLDCESRLSTSLELVEKNLTELEKLELGYSNTYVDTLIRISKGELQVVNIFEK